MEIKKVLTKDAESLLNILSSAKFINDFYLAGGTGLALQICHRRSVDFDFFSQKNKLLKNQREEIKNYLSSKGKVKILQDKDNTLDLLFKNIHVSFFYYDYKLIDSPKRIKGITIASIIDIGLMKLSSIISRGSKKDFIDLYFICEHVPLKKLLVYGSKKYPEFYDFKILAIKSLTYFFDADKEKMPVMIKKAKWEEIKKFFINETKKMLLK